MSKRGKSTKQVNSLVPLPGIGGGGAGYSPLPKKEGGDEVEKKGSYKRSGHYVDQVLKYNYPKNKQPSLFDKLNSETLKDIDNAGVEIEELVEGIKLTPSETKVIDCLLKLLHDNSQNLDPKR